MTKVSLKEARTFSLLCRKQIQTQSWIAEEFSSAPSPFPNKGRTCGLKKNQIINLSCN